MARRALVVAVVLGLAGLSSAQKTEEKASLQSFMFNLVAKARHVYVTSVYGDPFSFEVLASTSVFPAPNLAGQSTLAHSPHACSSDRDHDVDQCVSEGDRQAVVDVKDALRKWGRFIVRDYPDQGGLVIIVGKRLAGSKVVGRPHANIKLDNDVLLVYDADRLSPDPLAYSETNGLNPPELELLAQFRKDVERADKVAADRAADKAAKKAAKAAEKAAKKSAKKP